METENTSNERGFISASINIMRPVNCIMGSLTVIIGLLNTRTSVPFNILVINLILGVLTYFAIAASGMIINDIYDLEIDKINRPNRPLPRGELSITQARVLFGLTFGIGVLLSIFHWLFFDLSGLNVLLAIFFGFIGWLYAAWGKKSGFYGNLIVSVSFSIGLIYGAILNSSLIPIYIYFFFLTSFFLLLSREIVKGCEDIEGDREEGVKTLAIRLGIKKAMASAVVFEILAIIFFVLPYFTNIINPTLFLISMIFGLVDVIAAVFLSLRGNFEKGNLKKISLLLKVGAFLGLIAFIFASI
ncbi:MAG: hypothetical protein EU539_03190 [Promethearchaeota archaeon]|nr:MAG: hypothetical protein EU539_03190 [Candidatus Lokiarchaeota archaeon]